VPFIIGDQEDEGTLFALFQSNITTIPELVDYLSIFYFHNATRAQIEALVATYPDVTTDGSPFRTLFLNNWYPQFTVSGSRLPRETCHLPSPAGHF
jgi:hypothetical protein